MALGRQDGDGDMQECSDLLMRSAALMVGNESTAAHALGAVAEKGPRL